jgi:GTP-binding protein Era
MNLSEAPLSPEFKSGFVSIVGAPNAGKSTLLNRILGQKISITSRKPQTTRNRILGIAKRPAAQIVFLDTPGVHQARSPLNVRIVNTALATLGDVDVVLLLLDAAAPNPESENVLVGALRKLKQPVILALNKIDLIGPEAPATLLAVWRERFPFRAIEPISAKHGSRVDRLLDGIESALPSGPAYFPPDDITDLPERFIAAEMIREKVFRLTGQEIPYASAVTVDTFSEDPQRKLVTIHATIHVERDSQKGILIGKQGGKLKAIGAAARKDIEQMVGARVFLKLFVRVQKNWSTDTRALRKFGY